jgi:molybdopterin adenylyltransferase
MWSVGIITASDKGSRGEREDASAEIIRGLVQQELQGEVSIYRIVPDERAIIEETMIEMADVHKLNLILTTGGTGLSPRDVTPEATLAVADRIVPGFAEVMRSTTLAKTRRAMLSRAASVTRGDTLIINLPGSPKGVRECLEAIIDQVPHALEILTGKISDHGPSTSGGAR